VHIDHSHPEYFEALELYMNGDRNEAKKTFEDLVVKYPRDAHLFLLLGNIRYTLGQLGAASTAYESALALQPVFPQALFKLGVCLVRMGKLHEALRAFTKNVEIPKEGHVMSYYWIGLINNFLGDDEASFVAYNRLHEESEESMLSDFFLAQLHLKRHEQTKALDLLQKLLKVTPDFAEVHYLIGVAYSELHKNAEAIQKFRDVLKLDPDDKRAKNALDLYLNVPSI